MSFDTDHVKLLWPLNIEAPATNTEPPIPRLVVGCVFHGERKHTLSIVVVHWTGEGSAIYERISPGGTHAESVENCQWFRRTLENETSMLSVYFPGTGEVDRNVLNLLMADLVKRGFADGFVEEGTF